LTDFAGLRSFLPIHPCAPAVTALARASLLLLAAGCVLASATAAPAAASGTGPGSSFRNPVIPETAAGDDTPDPWIFRHAGRYWLTYTTAGHVEVRNARTLDGLASSTPKTLWPPAGQPEPADRCCQVWAPEIHRLNGPNGPRWYVYYSATSDAEGYTHGMYVLESTGSSPAGPYVFKGRLAVPQPYAIDATVGEIRGRLYLLYAGGVSFTPTSILIAPLSDPWTVAGAPVAVSSPTLSWETSFFAINEGPELLLHGGKVNVIYSASWCGSGDYALGRATVPQRADLLDPATWTGAKSPTPVFAGAPARGVYGPGHGSFFTSPDGRESWSVYHATEEKKGCFTGGLRTTRAQRFTWNADGTPDFGTPVSLGTDIAAPGGDGTIAVQAESAKAVRAASTRSEVVTDRRLFGYRGVALTPTGGAHALATMTVRVPRAGRYDVRVRVLAQPTAGTVTLRGPHGRPVNRSAVRATARAIDLDLGAFRLDAGPNALRLRGTKAITVDQIRLQVTR